MTTQSTDRIFRITYESFSIFSSKLYQCATYEETARCLQAHLKYLFNYEVFRVSAHIHDEILNLTISGNRVSFPPRSGNSVYDYEEQLLKDEKPFCLRHPETPGLLQFAGSGDGRNALWGWHFAFSKEKKILVSVLSGPQRPFTASSVPFIKLIAQILDAKLYELYLQKELAGRNQNLRKAVQVIHRKNREIQQIVDQQRQVILMRTHELEYKNRKLSEIALLNAHHVREPLSRILGLIHISGEHSGIDFRKDILPLLKQSSEDLDQALKRTIASATEVLKNSKKGFPANP